ncbi:hypothetical protein [Stappia sp. P2PMeth1]|uniref:hypothetical protein n=1 Tax=Stappia sp. P2PMeth1 TaxID=2003586 RepID=UPI0016451D38|nr:hypothetical protein [Stappia sp. P2PMeth1]
MTFARIRDVLLSLSLVLAVALAWPSMGKLPPRSGPAGPHPPASVEAAAAEAPASNAAAIRSSHGAHAHHRISPESAPNSASDAAPGSPPDCAPDMGCCVMTQCHPGLALALPEMPRTASLRAHEPGRPTAAAGIDPAILVPPPRILPV